MNDLLNDLSLREMALEEGARIIDIGCGLGQLSRGISRQVGSAGTVVGIERSTDQLTEARRLAAKDDEESLGFV